MFVLFRQLVVCPGSPASVPPADRHRQLPLSERDPTSLTKSQRKRLRKKLKMQNRGATNRFPLGCLIARLFFPPICFR